MISLAALLTVAAFAALLTVGASAPWQQAELEVIGRINYARTQGFDCVKRSYGAKPIAALVPHPKLREAARDHAVDMQARGYFAHDTPEGLTVENRVANAGYAAARASENIIGGQRLGSSARTVVQWWLQSPVHCKNIMNPLYTQIGAGHIYAPRDRTGLQHYWVIVFATPRPR